MATSTQHLTTTFTPNPSCLASTFSVGGKFRDAITYGYGNNVAVRGADPVCYPGSFYAIDSVVSGTSIAPFYSPGICPVGWTTATSTVPAGATVTTATCCPSLMSPEHNIKTGGSLATWCVGGFYTAETGGPGTTDVVIVTPVVTSSSTTVVTKTTGIYVSYQLPIVIQYQASDVSLFSSVPTSSASATPTGTPTTGANSADSTNNNSGGLSSGASIGIGVGIGIGVLIILILAGLLFWTRRKHARAAAAAAGTGSSGAGATAAAASQPLAQDQDPQYSYEQEHKVGAGAGGWGNAQQAPVEAPYHQPIYEADAGTRNPAELPTQWHGYEAAPASAHPGGFYKPT